MVLMLYNLYNKYGDYSMKAQWIFSLFLATLISGGCTSSLPIAREPQVLPTLGDTYQMTPSAPGIQSLIEKIKEDLAKRLSITMAEITVVEASEVIWPDSSLGCPQKGMAYLQVLTPGYLIVLEYANNQYEYHAGLGQDYIYCTNPTAPIPSPPSSS
jgi:hypothetical protein